MPVDILQRTGVRGLDILGLRKRFREEGSPMPTFDTDAFEGFRNNATTTGTFVLADDSQLLMKEASLRGYNEISSWDDEVSKCST
jgi:hypothetical protein